MNRIKSLSIISFRHLNHLNDMKIGEKITVIAGVNGTGKSSLLGLIGHIFSFRISSEIVKTIDNKPFETIFSEVFRFSPKYDYQSQYTYSLTFQDGSKKEAVSRYDRKNKRFRIDVGTRQRNKGKVKLPVVYLSLKRLIPLAQESEKSIRTIQDNKLTNEDKELYRQWHNQVLVINDKVVPKHTKSWNKEIFYAECEKYDAYGNSAGQDNLAQIILALLSFKKLKEEMQQNYPGGLLIIDEVDTTLYPAAQRQLMQVFLKAARDYDIQIIFTTHSIEIIGYMLDPNKMDYYYSSEIIYLHNPTGAVEVIQDKDQMNGIIDDLRHEVSTKKIKRKINVYLEDEEARIFLKGLIPRDISTKLEIKKFNHGADSYKSLLEEKFPEFRNSLIVLDGDKSTDAKLKRQKNVSFLPGTLRPENVFLNYLNELPPESPFWDSTPGGYNKNVFLMHKPTLGANREVMKQWFNEEKKYWGNRCNKIINQWKNDNQNVVKTFIETQKKKIEKIET